MDEELDDTNATNNLGKSILSTICKFIAFLQAIICIAAIVISLKGWAYPVTSNDAFQQCLAEQPLQFCDFRLFYGTGKMVVAPESKEIYSKTAQHDYFAKTLKPPMDGYVSLAPYFFLLMIPISQLPLHSAVAVWTAASMTLAFAGLSLVGRYAGRRLFEVAGIFIGMTASIPAVNCLDMGQSSWLYVGLYSLFFLTFLTRQNVLCGAIASLVAIKPHYAAFLMLAPLAHGRIRVIASFAVITIALLAITIPFIGLSNVINYPVFALNGLNSRDLAWTMNPKQTIGLAGLLHIALPWPVATVCTMVVSLAGLLAIFYLWWRVRNASSTAQIWASATTIILVLLMSPHSHLYDCLFLGIPAVLTLPTLNLERLCRTGPNSFRIWNLMFYFYPFLSLLILLYRIPLGVCCNVPFIMINICLIVCGLCYLKHVMAERHQVS